MAMVTYIFFFPPFLPLLIRLFFPTAILGKDGRHDATSNMHQARRLGWARPAVTPNLASRLGLVLGSRGGLRYSAHPTSLSSAQAGHGRSSVSSQRNIQAQVSNVVMVLVADSEPRQKAEELKRSGNDPAPVQGFGAVYRKIQCPYHSSHDSC